VECAFGSLSNKRKIFQPPLNASPDFAVETVKVYVVLHNFVRERDCCKFENAMTVTGLEDVSDGQSVCWGLRNKVADYFLTRWSRSLANVKNMNSRV
jgi:hypothetical protein